MSSTIDNHVIPMDMYNVFRLCPKDKDPTEPRFADCRVDPMMANLIRDLSRQRPAWKFYGFGWGDACPDGHYAITRFYVDEEDTQLGEVGLTYVYRRGVARTSYQIKNKRIYVAMQKRAHEGRVTRDLKSAAKIVLHNFFLPTLAEISAVARSATSSKVQRLYTAAEGRFRNAADGLRDALVDFVAGHWEEFARVPLSAGLVAYRDTLLSAHAEAKDMRTLTTAHAQHRGALVLVRGEHYLMSDLGPSDLRPGVPPEDVPGCIKAAIGMLKLVDVGAHIPDVGVRVDENLFFTMPKEDS